MSDDSTPCACNGARWVCDEHDLPACGCGSALKPCACNENATVPPGGRCVACADD